MSENQDPEAAETVQTESIKAVDPAAICSAVGEIIETLGQEWIVPDSYWECGSGAAMVPYGGSAAIKTSFGWLVLAKVERVISGPNRGEIRRTIMKASDFHQQNK